MAQKIASVAPGEMILDPRRTSELMAALDEAGVAPLLKRARPPRPERTRGRVLDDRDDPTVELPPRG